MSYKIKPNVLHSELSSGNFKGRTPADVFSEWIELDLIDDNENTLLDELEVIFMQLKREYNFTSEVAVDTIMTVLSIMG